MKDFYNKLCLLLLEEYFGSIVQYIASSLLYGRKTLGALRFETRLPVVKVNSDKYSCIIYINNEEYVVT